MRTRALRRALPLAAALALASCEGEGVFNQVKLNALPAGALLDLAATRSPSGSTPPDCSSLEAYLKNSPAGPMERMPGLGVNATNLYWFAVRDCKVKTANELLEKLPLDFRRNWLVNYNSASLQGGSRKFPRIILFSHDGKSMMGISTDPSGPHYLNLEFIEWNEEGQNFLPISIQFQDAEGSFGAAKVEVNPAVCATCHGGGASDKLLEFRPFMTAYNFWPYFFGSSSKNFRTAIACKKDPAARIGGVELAKWKSGDWEPELCDSEEARAYLQWVKETVGSGRFRFLPRPKPWWQRYALDESQQPPLGGVTGDPRGVYEHPEHFFSVNVVDGRPEILPVNGGFVSKELCDKIQQSDPETAKNLYCELAAERPLSQITQSLADLNKKRIIRQIVNGLYYHRELAPIYAAISNDCIQWEPGGADAGKFQGRLEDFVPGSLRINGRTFAEFVDKLRSERKACGQAIRAIQQSQSPFPEGDGFQFDDFDNKEGSRYQKPFLQYALLAFLSQKVGLNHEAWSLTPSFIRTPEGSMQSLGPCHQFSNPRVHTFEELTVALAEELKIRSLSPKDSPCEVLWLNALKAFGKAETGCP